MTPQYDGKPENGMDHGDSWWPDWLLQADCSSDFTNTIYSQPGEVKQLSASPPLSSSLISLITLFILSERSPPAVAVGLSVIFRDTVTRRVMFCTAGGNGHMLQCSRGHEAEGYSVDLFLILPKFPSVKWFNLKQMEYELGSLTMFGGKIPTHYSLVSQTAALMAHFGNSERS